MADVLVSFLIPALNSERTIISAIASITKQWPAPLFEIIVRDGSNNRKTEEAVRSLGLTNLRYISNPQSPSVGCARKELIKAASGRYSCFVDSDDRISDDHAKILLPILSADSTDLVWFNYEINEPTTGSKIARSHTTAADLNEDSDSLICSALLGGDSCNALWDKSIRTSLLQTIAPFVDPRFSFGEDRMILLRLFLSFSALHITYLNHPLYRYSINPNGLNRIFHPSYLTCLRENWILTNQLYGARLSENLPAPERYIVKTFVDYRLSQRYVPRSERKEFGRVVKETARSELFLRAMETMKVQDRALYWQARIAANMPYHLAKICLRFLKGEK